jgi:7,8-dihydropterin-6-yl-methyl-4-(beta-D-ribofuranosyl)aminobenzene 5'-phosphate synthase
VRARCIVGGLGGSAHNPYLLREIVAELRLLGVRCVVAVHNAPQFVRELERRFNVYRMARALLWSSSTPAPARL